jgi:hypothetical protein
LSTYHLATGTEVGPSAHIPNARRCVGPTRASVGGLPLSGESAFKLQGPADELIEDAYAVEIRAPPGFQWG